MFEQFFRGVFDSDLTRVISAGDFLLCLGCALALGLGIALSYRSRSSRSYRLTLALLPGVVCIVIMMVNGNVGTGVAVAGAFSLVRFRSVPGTGQEICALFLAMGAGLLCGMGYLGFGLLFSLVMCLALLLYQRCGFGGSRESADGRQVNLCIPESLDYTGVFDPVFREYTLRYELIRVKSSNMGSLFKLSYRVQLRDPAREKEMIDALRCRNGNLEISVSRLESGAEL